MHSPSSSMALNLASFPEELLERILALCVVAPPFPPTRPSWHHPSSPPSATSAARNSSSAPRGRLAPLLVCRSFRRIATPLFYHTLHLSSKPQLQHLLAHALRPHPELAAYVRRIVIAGVWAEGGELLRRCRRGLRSLDITLDIAALEIVAEAPEGDAEAFCAALCSLKGLTHIAVRKPASVYLTQAKPRYMIWEIAKAMQGWNNLESADIAFRLSDDSVSPSTLSYLHPSPFSSPAQTPKAVQSGPVTALTHALSTRPRLHTLATLLPSVWNEALLRVSENPRLVRIVLGDGAGAGGGGGGIVGTGLFLMQARKHVRLSELIRAGTPIIRSRAHTMGTVPPPMPSSVPTMCPPMRKGTSTGAPLSSTSSSQRRFTSSSSSSSSSSSASRHEWTETSHQKPVQASRSSRVFAGPSQ